MKQFWLGLVFSFLCFVSSGRFELVYAQGAPDGKSVMNEMLTAYYYPLTDAKSEAFMRIVNRQGQTRERRLAMLRLDETVGGKQSYYLYFHEPPHV